MEGFNIKLLQNILVMVALLSLIRNGGLVVIHLYTVFLFFTHYGIWQAFIALFLPVISQFFLAYHLTMEFGWSNQYNLLLIVCVITYILTFIIGLVLMVIGVYVTEKIKKETLNG